MSKDFLALHFVPTKPTPLNYNPDHASTMDNSSDHASFDEQHGYHRFHQLDESMFPGGNNDFKSDFAVRTLGEERDILNRSRAYPLPISFLLVVVRESLTHDILASPPPPSTNSDDWRYHGNRVYTGESFVYAPRPRPGSEEAWGMQPSGTPRGTNISQNQRF
ncbi:hypothetical protein P153DRAFT_369713 [Dothidotthia symphoricarpi CBS 119687]|uniref:Uncharacterized protein n=1 Tax=Dothidotthia symphoricarpi CBS 119687 TaxID=1392245 RepID=A0A6A6A120_9PLEO|nr:uncharacterized protein P153DRAFT_369713 [Dothidotthia symphoricarpi CBS 119687]KAF2125702.1 hypothetical protein P153DRAFT_369713 [Dothidotthia symphoricarpi CBS 119687]